MAKAIIHYISELLLVYQAHTQKTCSEMALDFDIALSNLYLYRNETLTKLSTKWRQTVRKHFGRFAGHE